MSAVSRHRGLDRLPALGCKYLIKGRTMTGFANVEERYADEYVGKQVMPWQIENAAQERGANYIQAGRFKAFAVRDGCLITGQQTVLRRRGREAGDRGAGNVTVSVRGRPSGRRGSQLRG